ncbi:MAG: polysaccharide biosynthesis/export family protein [Thermodesulfobacteriota bacterium]
MGRSRLAALLLAAALLAAAAGCSRKADLAVREERELSGATFSQEEGAYPAALNLFPKYLLQPGDVLDVLYQIRTWEEDPDFALAVDHTVSVKFVHAPELNETQIVQPNGMISLPYLGEVKVSGLTVAGLATLLREKYAAILKDPELYVTVPDFRQRIKELKADLHTAPRGLSRLVTVRPDGYCTFFLAGDIYVAGRSIPEVKKELDEVYNRQLAGLYVDLFLEKHSGSVIYVLGQVKTSGVYSIAKPVTVTQSLAMAGGLASDADLSRTLVFRLRGKKLTATRLDLASHLAVNQDSQFFFLMPDDIVFVPRTGLSETAEAMRYVGDIIFFRGWGSSFDGPLFEEPVVRRRDSRP